MIFNPRINNFIYNPSITVCYYYYYYPATATVIIIYNATICHLFTLPNPECHGITLSSLRGAAE